MEVHSKLTFERILTSTVDLRRKYLLFSVYQCVKCCYDKVVGLYIHALGTLLLGRKEVREVVVQETGQLRNCLQSFPLSRRSPGIHDNTCASRILEKDLKAFSRCYHYQIQETEIDHPNNLFQPSTLVDLFLLLPKPQNSKLKMPLYLLVWETSSSFFFTTCAVHRRV